MLVLQGKRKGDRATDHPQEGSNRRREELKISSWGFQVRLRAAQGSGLYALVGQKLGKRLELGYIDRIGSSTSETKMWNRCPKGVSVALVRLTLKKQDRDAGSRIVGHR